MLGVVRWLTQRLGWIPGLMRVPDGDDVAFRRGVERVLHDEVAIGLSAMVIQLDLMSAADGVSTDAALIERVSAVRGAMCAAIEDARRLAGMVYPPVLRGSGLAPALRATAEYRELRLRLDLPTYDLAVAMQSRLGLLVTDRLHTLRPGAEVWVRVRGRRFVRVRITERRPGCGRRCHWAVAACE